MAKKKVKIDHFEMFLPIFFLVQMMLWELFSDVLTTRGHTSTCSVAAVLV